ncbi:MAG: chorismate synthase [Ruminococcaceae bacterium]|nr:chorismate synthase [Oscillospiraceae bacterium]
MKNTIGNNLSVTLFGESHGEAIGAVIDGLAAGIDINEENIRNALALRRPAGKISTARCEADEFRILSGAFGGKTTGTPLCIVIENSDTRSKDYESEIPRPSHADYTANVKYNGFEDYRGGGHFSGRITAALVAAGAIISSALNDKGILIGTHISRLGGIDDIRFSDYASELNALNKKEFAVLDDAIGEKMKAKIIEAKEKGDSVGGVLETAVLGMPVGVGEPWFDTVEGMLSKAIFSVPAVKGIEFGGGFSVADMYGSEANDAFIVENGKVVTKTNYSGGINGGITNGMPIIFRTAIKPTPTILIEQDSVNLKTMENVKFKAKGRHDPAIVHRARIVVDSVTAIVLADLLVTRYGTDWLVK